MLVYIACILLVLYGIFLWVTQNNGYWKKRNVPFVAPSFLFGNMKEMFLGKKSNGIIAEEAYNKYDGPYVGMFDMRRPVLLIRHPDLVKQVLVTEFNKFHDNVFELNEEADPILAKSPFFAKGDRWKIIRSQITPLLTTNKVKLMYPLVQQNCKNMVTYLEASVEEIEGKELALKFTADNVATCAFGLEGRSFTDPEAEFKNLAEQFLQVTPLGMVRFFLMSLFPFLANVIKIPIGQKSVSDKFKAILIETMNFRKENNVVRNDFLDSVIELKSKPLPFEYTDDYIVAHAFTFFLDGSETSAVVFSFALLELALNLDVQDKLRQEVNEVLKKHGREMTFESISEMQYLDAVFQESLRKYPPLMFMTRNCTQDTLLPSWDSAPPLKIEKGTHVWISVSGLHWDPQHFENPERFDPDRFVGKSLPKSCFLGFGAGPRMCLGQKFANMQIKTALATLVSQFEIRVGKRMALPVEIDPVNFITAAKSGIWLKFYKRKIDRIN